MRGERRQARNTQADTLPHPGTASNPVPGWLLRGWLIRLVRDRTLLQRLDDAAASARGCQAISPRLGFLCLPWPCAMPARGEHQSLPDPSPAGVLRFRRHAVRVRCGELDHACAEEAAMLHVRRRIRSTL